ncbi:MAG: hypothetical protein JKX70_02080 [Phycisphaerales bacterium]|nr:hypothetical protein [Phycisphaerales bacterium]
MNKRTLIILGTLLTAALANASEPGIWIDQQGDAVIRRTDLGNDAALPAGFVPLDLLKVSSEGWVPTDPSLDLYLGVTTIEDADFVRIQVVVDGLIAPPGPIGLNGFPYNPYQFGDRPLTGFIDIDIDDQKDSGGELMPMAASRYLANVGRFGMSPQGSIAERIAQSGDDIDFNFFDGPDFERTGAEFTLVLCGCFSPVIVSQNGNMDSQFDSGESWVVEGRFFERFESFEPLSAMFGGSDFGLFDPITTLQFVHDPKADQTTVTLVYPITNAGTAQIAGHPEQEIDLSLTNDTSIEEAIDDLIDGADFATGALRTLTKEWREQDFEDYREPAEWKITALIGTAPLKAQPDSFYIWTDTGFDELHADFNLDGVNDAQDLGAFEDFIDDEDGGSFDDDQVVNGEIGIEDFGLSFHFFDLNYDGVVSDADIPLSPCLADLTGDGVLNFFDVSAFLIAFSAQSPEADLTSDGSWNFFDVAAYLTLFAQGCP